MLSGSTSASWFSALHNTNSSGLPACGWVVGSARAVQLSNAIARQHSRMVEIIARTLSFPRTNMHVAERSCSDQDFCVARNDVRRHDHSAMVKFCRECSALMPGRARYCPQCARRWLPVGAHHLAEAADLLQPPVN